MATVESKIKSKPLARILSGLTVQHLTSELSKPELHSLRTKVKQAIDNHHKAESDAKPLHSMSAREFQEYSNRLMRAKGKDVHE